MAATVGQKRLAPKAGKGPQKAEKPAPRSEGAPYRIVILSAICFIGSFFLPAASPSAPARQSAPATASVAEADGESGEIAEEKDTRAMSAVIEPVEVVEAPEEPAVVADELVFGAVNERGVDDRIALLSGIFNTGSVKDKRSAYRALVRLDHQLKPRLPALIAANTDAAIVYFVRAAQELQAVNAVPALIQRLRDASKSGHGRFEIFSALASLPTPEAQEYVLRVMKGEVAFERTAVWSSIGAGMTAAQREYAIQITAAGGREAKWAARALGRFGKEVEAARKVVPAIEFTFAKAPLSGKLALVAALTEMETDVAGLALRGWVADSQPEVRAAVVLALAVKSPYNEAVVEALRTDNEMVVRAAAIRALVMAPNVAALPELVSALGEPELAGSAREALIKANDGVDLGQTFRWQEWLKARTTLPTGEPVVSVTE